MDLKNQVEKEIFMAQRNIMVANVCSIRTPENGEWVSVKKLKGVGEKGTQAFVTLIEDFFNKNEEKMDKRYITFSYFIPEGMEIRTGQTVTAQFVVDTYETAEGLSELSFKIIKLNFVNSRNSATTGGHGIHMPEIEEYEDIKEELPFN